MVNPTTVEDTRPKFGEARLRLPGNVANSPSIHHSQSKNIGPKLRTSDVNSQVIDPHRVVVSTKIN